AWCEAQGITVLGPDRVGELARVLDALAGRCDQLYVDLDVDVLDRAFAPGCPGARPGGITPRELFDAAFAALRRALPDEAILELSYAVGTYRLHAMICRALRLEYDDIEERIVEVPAPGQRGAIDVMGQIARQ
ncbi:MAG: hypothetical protein C4321_08055, partial [Chloroflexota bacterium]